MIFNILLTIMAVFAAFRLGVTITCGNLLLEEKLSYSDYKKYTSFKGCIELIKKSINM